MIRVRDNGIAERELSFLRAGGVAWLVGGGLSLLGSAGDRSDLWSILAATAAIVASEAIGRRSTRGDRARWTALAQSGLEVAAAVIVVIGTRPAGDSPVWFALALPSIAAAIRAGVDGAVVSWVALAVPLFVDLTLRWAPGDGYAGVSDLSQRLGAGLVLGTVVGLLAARVRDEVTTAREVRLTAEHRGRSLASLSVAAEHLAAADTNEISATAIDATIELGYDAATLIVVDGTTGSITELGSAGAVAVDTEGVAEAVAGRAAEDGAGSSVGTPLGSAVRTSVDMAGGRRMATLAQRHGRSLVLIASSPGAPHGSLDTLLRNESFDLLVAYLATALRTATRERDAAAELRRATRARVPTATPAARNVTRAVASPEIVYQ